MPPLPSHELREQWLGYNETYGLDRWLEYADVYERHLPAPCADAERGSFKLLEIGVQSGGAARAWKQRYGHQLYYTGIDIEPTTRRAHSPDENIHVEIGSQADADFLLRVCRKHGPFDVVIDDGSHRPVHMWASLAAIWPHNACMRAHSVYVVEDTHSMVMPRAFLAACEAPHDIYDLAGEAFWSIHSHWAYGGAARYPDGASHHPIFKQLVRAVYAYDSILVLARGPPPRPRMTMVKRGQDFIAYGQGSPPKQLQEGGGRAGGCAARGTRTPTRPEGASSAR